MVNIPLLKQQIVQNKIKKIAIYSRVSRDEEENGDRIDNHKIMLSNIGKQLPCIFVELYEQGSSESWDRPVFQQLIQLIKNEEIQAVLVKHTDRISRDFSHYTQFANLLDNYGVILLTPEGILDTNAVVNQLTGMMAHIEMTLIKGRMRTGKLTSASKGNWVASNAPYGYTYNPITKKLCVLPEEAEAIKLAFKLYKGDEGGISKTFEQIASILDERKIKSRRGKYISSKIISDWFSNEVYIGNIVFNKTTGGYHSKDKKFRYNKENDIVRTEKAHEAIIDSDTFYYVQQLRKSRQAVPNRTLNQTFALTGLLKCPNGHSLSFNRKLDRTGKEYILAKLCQHKTEGKYTCPEHSGARVEPIINYIISNLFNEITSLEKLYIEEKKKSNLKIDTSAIDKLIKKLNDDIQIIKHKKSKLMDLLLDGTFSSNDYNEKNAELENKLEELNTELKDLIYQKSQTKTSTEILETQLQLLLNIKENWNNNLTEQRKNQLLSSIIDFITLNKKKNEKNYTFFVKFKHS